MFLECFDLFHLKRALRQETPQSKPFDVLAGYTELASDGTKVRGVMKGATNLVDGDTVHVIELEAYCDPPKLPPR